MKTNKLNSDTSNFDFDFRAIIVSTLLVTGFIYIWNINKAGAIFAGITTLTIAPTLVVESTKESAKTIAKTINTITKQGE